MTDALPTTLSGVRSVLGVVQYDEPRDETVFLSTAKKLRDLYAPVLGEHVCIRTRWLPALSAGVVVIEESTAETSLSDPVVWGLPVGATGTATADEIGSALREPQIGARRLDGIFCLVRSGAAGLRVVTSATMAHTIKRVRGAHATAWATRGWAAHVLAEKQPRLNEAAVAEFIQVDYPLVADELLADTVVLRDAQVIDISAAGSSESSYWPLEERLAPGRPSTATDIRRVVCAAVRPMVRIRNISLGLTAGLDSGLTASCIAENGDSVDTFTFGRRTYPDPRGARAIARQLGWSHTVVPSTVARPEWPRMATLSTWSEGLQVGSALLEPTYRWGRFDVAWLAGLGGEVGGRAFYWARGDGTRQWLDGFAANIRQRFEPATADAFLDRFAATLDGVRALGRDETDLADAFFATGRMHKWVARLLPTPHLEHVVPAFLSAPVVRTLLNIPTAERRAGGTYDAALALGPGNLHGVAARAAYRHPRLMRRMSQQLQARQARQVTHLLATTPHEPVTRAILGPRWWDVTLTRAEKVPWARRQAWNAVAVEALAHALET